MSERHLVKELTVLGAVSNNFAPEFFIGVLKTHTWIPRQWIFSIGRDLRDMIIGMQHERWMDWKEEPCIHLVNSYSFSKYSYCGYCEAFNGERAERCGHRIIALFPEV